MNKWGKSFILFASGLVVLSLNPSTSGAEVLKIDTNPYLVHAYQKVCKHGLHPQPNGPFSVFLFCDDSIGSNIGVILTEPGGYPKPNQPINEAFKQNLKGDFAWDENNRFWQEEPWSADVTSFAWSSSGLFLYVATSGMYGNGSLFRLNLGRRTADKLYPPVNLDTGGQRFETDIKSVNVDVEEMIVTLEAYGEKSKKIDERTIHMD